MDDQIYFCAITSKFPGCFAANLFTLANWQSRRLARLPALLKRVFVEQPLPRP